MSATFQSLISDVGGIPVNTVLPSITGDPGIPNTLAVDDGTWLNFPTSFTYQWIRNGADITGETADTYTTEAADNGSILTVRVTAINSAGNATVISNVFPPGEGFFIPTDALGSDLNTEWVDFSDGTNTCSDEGDFIKMLDNSSTGGNQTKLRTLGYPLSDDMLIRYTIEIQQLNDISSWNPTDLDDVPIDADDTGDNPLNRVGFSFPIVHPIATRRAQIWFQKELDYATTGNIGIWTVIDDAPNFIFRRLAITDAIPIGTIFSFSVRTRLKQDFDFEMDMYISNEIVLNDQAIGMASNVGGHNSVVFQVKGTAAEPVEVDIYKVEYFDTSNQNITFIEQSVVPADNSSNATTSLSIPVPTSIATGDLILVIWGDRQTVGTPTYTITNAANQSWTTSTSAISSINWYWATYNGSFSGATHIVFNSSTGTCTSALLFVFRNSGGASSWTIDVSLDEEVTASAVAHVAPGITVSSGSVLAITTFLASTSRQAFWYGPGWKTPTSTQYRNTAGSDRTYAIAYKVMNGAGGTGYVDCHMSPGLALLQAQFSLKANP